MRDRGPFPSPRPSAPGAPKLDPKHNFQDASDCSTSRNDPRHSQTDALSTASPLFVSSCRRMHKGRELDDDKTLAELGVTEVGAEIITVRKVLVAEGWKIMQDDDEDSDTEEDDF